MKFEYQAMDSHGELVNGVEEAKNFKEFVAILFHKKLRPFDIRRVSESRKKAHGDLEHLKKLKGKIEGTDTENEIKPQPIKPKFKLTIPKLRIDYIYILFLVIMVGLVYIAVERGL